MRRSGADMVFDVRVAFTQEGARGLPDGSWLRRRQDGTFDVFAPDNLGSVNSVARLDRH